MYTEVVGFYETMGFGQIGPPLVSSDGTVLSVSSMDDLWDAYLFELTAPARVPFEGHTHVKEVFDMS